MDMKKFLIEKMTPAIKELVREENWKDIPSFFSRVYVIEYAENVEAYVVGYWDCPNPLIAFDSVEYQFVGVVMQDWTEENGVQII